MAMENEIRWVVVTKDGGHVSIGRGRGLAASKIEDAEAALLRQGCAGWLARVDGDYYARGAISVEMVRPMAGAVAADWPAALSAFFMRRASVGAMP